tara:strand:- start:887 stop:1522 length:636 start_codon:yes stop_codon:yes gene_type:complete
MKKNFILKNLVFFNIFFFLTFIQNDLKSQTNSSTVTNSTSPAASATTTGGTSVNYQTNSSFSNDIGFGTGYVCRTPSVVINTSVASADSENWAALGNSGTYGENITGSIGLVFPFGSKVMNYCETIAKQTAKDKEISTQLSMLRACASLKKEGISVDPNKFPLLSDCVVEFGEPELSLDYKKISNKIAKQEPKKIKKPKLKLTKIPILVED